VEFAHQRCVSRNLEILGHATPHRRFSQQQEVLLRDDSLQLNEALSTYDAVLSSDRHAEPMRNYDARPCKMYDLCRSVGSVQRSSETVGYT
jgi:hypothetical protein